MKALFQEKYSFDLIKLFFNMKNDMELILSFFEDRCLGKKYFSNIIIVFYTLFFLAILVFFLLVHPLYIFDSDDWGNMGVGRSVFPQMSSFNPIKVFPEAFFPLVSFFSARIIYPLTGDYISSLGIGFAFIYSVVILCSALCLHKYLNFIRVCFSPDKKLQDDTFVTICLVIIFFLYLFYFGRNGIYLLSEVNVTCIFHYSIPAILNFSVVLLLICFEKRNKQILSFENSYLNVFWALALYLCIFSNLFISSVLLAYVCFFLFRRAVSIQFSSSGLSLKNTIKLYVIRNYQYIAVLLIWFLSAVFESQGGRAEIGRHNNFSFASFSNSLSFFFCQTLKSVAFGKVSFVGILLFVSANLLLLVHIFKKRASDQDKTFLSIQLNLLWMVLFTVLYHIMLTVKTGVGYQERPSLIFCWIVWILLEFACCFIYTSSYIPKINSFLPIVILVLIYRVCIHNPVFCEVNFVPYSNINSVKDLGNDFIRILENSDRNGLSKVELHVPKFDSNDNFPIAVYVGSSLADTLYLQGITKRLMQITIIPDEKLNKQYSLP